MNINLISSIVLALTVISFPFWAEGQNLGAKSGNLSQKVGQSKLAAGKEARPNNTPGINVNPNSGRSNGPGNNFKKSHDNRRDSDDNKNNSHDGHDKWHGHNQHHKRPHKFNPLYAPYYYFGYNGYAPYTNYYAYADPDYPLGYGTTLGTTLERPSNLEVNQFGQDSPAPAEYQQDNPDAGYVNTDSPEQDAADYYNPPPAEEQTIYVWVDESGVRNYVNDIDFVPTKYRDVVTTLGAE
jgi:hypothetical protein